MQTLLSTYAFELCKVFCLATIGAMHFRASTSIGALFIVHKIADGLKRDKGKYYEKESNY